MPCPRQVAGVEAIIDVAPMDPGLRLGLHPSVARQILLDLITGLRACTGERAPADGGSPRRRERPPNPAAQSAGAGRGPHISAQA